MKKAEKTKLKAVVPQEIKKRLKMFLYGASGVGKTTAALQFPNAYIIDLEKGTENYVATISKSGSRVFQSNDFYEIKEQIEALLTEDHEFKTLIIDPITILYLAIQDVWTRKFEAEAREKNKAPNADMQDFGMRFWGKVKSDYKALQRLIMKLDMNVIVTAHQKDVYGNGFNKVGVTFDSMKGDDYFFDNVFRLEKRGKDRVAVVVKQRCEIDNPIFPEEFQWSYDNFKKFYGAEAVERKATAVPMASAEQVRKIKALLEVVKMRDDWQDKVFSKADADNWEELTSDQIEKCIAQVEKIKEGA